MNSIIFGVMVALAVTCHISAIMHTVIAMKAQREYSPFGWLSVATICTGIAASMTYGA